MMLIAASVLDTKTGVFMAPMFVAHEAVAVRAVIEAAADRRTVLSRHPADFALVILGTFDDQTGEMMASAPRTVGTVVSLIPRGNAELFNAESDKEDTNNA